MIRYKKIDPETALRMIAQLVGETLPEDIKNSDAELTLSFDDDHSVDIYLVNPNAEELKS